MRTHITSSIVLVLMSGENTHTTVSTSIFYCIAYCVKEVRNQKTIILFVHAQMLMLVLWAVSHYHYAYDMTSPVSDQDEANLAL